MSKKCIYAVINTICEKGYFHKEQKMCYFQKMEFHGAQRLSHSAT